jgi:hypothetical protein
MNRTKYPRTKNLPFSQSNSSDDVWWKDCTLLDGQLVVVTEKLDGECTTVYRDGWTHARSLDSGPHPSRSWMKGYAAQWAHEIPDGWRVCGENLYAWHSIFYTELPTYFFVFGIYNEHNECVAWKDVEEFCGLLGLHTVPVLFSGIWDEKTTREQWTGKGTFPTFTDPDQSQPCEAEGFVIRVADAFPYTAFAQHCAKWVRAHHVQTDQNWMQRPVSPNLLKVALRS